MRRHSKPRLWLRPWREAPEMKIAIVGYGKMGRMIEGVAASRGHDVIARFDIDNNRNGEGLRAENLKGVDVAVEVLTPGTPGEKLRRLIGLRNPAGVRATRGGRPARVVCAPGRDQTTGRGSQQPAGVRR